MSARRSKFTLRQFEVLVAVADHSSITHAADRLLVSQPSVTRTIQDIEAAVGASLFDRAPRGMIPTVFGESLIRHARAILSELRLAEEDMDSLHGNAKGVVRIGTTPIGASLLIPLAVTNLVKKYPGLRVEIIEDDFAKLRNSLHAGAMDLVVGPSSEEALDPGVGMAQLCTDDLIVVASPGHRLSGATAVPMSQTITERWVMPPQFNRLWRRLESRFLADGLTMPDPAVISASSAVVKSILQHGNWLTVYPRLIVQEDLRDGLFGEVGLAGGAMKWDVVSYFRTTGALSPASQALQTELEIAVTELRAQR